MTAYQLFQELSRESFWASQPRKVRFIAARFYAGRESLAELRSHGQPQPAYREDLLPAILTEQQIKIIIDAR